MWKHPEVLDHDKGLFVFTSNGPSLSKIIKREETTGHHLRIALFFLLLRSVHDNIPRTNRVYILLSSEDEVSLICFHCHFQLSSQGVWPQSPWWKVGHQGSWLVVSICEVGMSVVQLSVLLFIPQRIGLRLFLSCRITGKWKRQIYYHNKSILDTTFHLSTQEVWSLVCVRVCAFTCMCALWVEISNYVVSI